MKYIIPIIILSFVLLSCAKEEDDSSSTTSTELEGTWVTSCNTASWSNTEYVIQTITVTGSALVWKWDEHSDSSCSNDYAIWTDTYSSLSLGNEVTLDNGSTAIKITVNVEGLEGLMQTSAAVTDYNNDGWCNITDWALNTAKDYSGKTCGNTTYPAKNDTVTGVYKLDGSSLLINTDNITSVGSTVFTKQ